MPETTVTGPNGEKFTVTHPEGATREQILEFAYRNAPNTAGGLAKAGATGVAKGIGYLFGGGRDLMHLAGQGLESIPGGQTIKDALKSLPPVKAALALPGSEDINKNVEKGVKYGQGLAGVPEEQQGFHTASTPGERVAESAGSFLPGAVVGGPGGLLTRSAMASGTGALSEYAGQKAEDAFGPTAGTATRTLTALFTPTGARKAITPARANPERLAQAAKLTEEANASGINALKPTAGEKTGYEPQLAREKTFNPDREQEVQKGLNQYYTGKAGTQADVASTGPQGWLAQNRREVGDLFNQLEANTSMTSNHVANLNTDLKGIKGQYSDSAAVKGALKDIKKAVKKGGGDITGTDYKNLRSDLSAQKYAASGTGKRGLDAILDALDTHMEASIGQNTPEHLGQFGLARARSQMQRSIDKAVESSTGNIPPARMERAAKRVYGTQKYNEGGEPFEKVTGAAQTVYDRGTKGRHTTGPAMGPFEKAGLVAGLGTLAKHFVGGAPLTDTFKAESYGPLLTGEYGGRGLDVISKALKTPGNRFLASKTGQAYMGNQLQPLRDQDRLRRTLGYLLRGQATAGNQNQNR